MYVAKRTAKMEGVFYADQQWVLPTGYPAYLLGFINAAIENGEAQFLSHDPEHAQLWIGEKEFVYRQESDRFVSDMRQETELHFQSMHNQGEKIGFWKLHSLIQAQDDSPSYFVQRAQDFLASPQADQYFDGRDWLGWPISTSDDGQRVFIDCHRTMGALFSVLTGVPSIICQWWVDAHSKNMFLKIKNLDSAGKLIDRVESWNGFCDFYDEMWKPLRFCSGENNLPMIILIIEWAKEKVEIGTLMTMRTDWYLLDGGNPMDAHMRERRVISSIKGTGLEHILEPPYMQI